VLGEWANAGFFIHAAENRALTVVVDVSCDYTSANNPIPIYNMATTFDAPTVRVEGIPYEPFDMPRS
jgi:saccharopine dehydrogenase (NAD+, L-lysine-forming)